LLRETKQGRCSWKGRADALPKMLEARKGGWARKGSAGPRGKAWWMREARQCGCAKQSKAVAHYKAGQMGNARQGRYAMRGREDARGKARQ
jgi:hypothetical protein